jgi:hypothetical protein
MAMPNGYVDPDDLESLLEDLDDFETDESEDDRAERRRAPSRAMRPPPTSGGSGLYKPRPTGGSEPVNQMQLEAALARVGAELKTNAKAIDTVSARLGTFDTKQQQQVTALRKESTERKRQAAAMRADLRRANQNSMMLMLLSRPKPTQTITTASADTIGGTPVPANTKLVVDQGTSSTGLDPLLMIMMLGGLGGGGGGSYGGGNGSSGGESQGEDNSLMLMMAMGAL